ncbi:MAG: DUF5602 domain-containing protein [Ectothiorhodospiraceae bacterium]|nr:DUF5602 domain-containing protein [Ectothiorhodospiraceae bacterium]
MHTTWDRTRVARPRWLPAILGATLISVSSAVSAETRYGPELTLGDGFARVYLVTDNGAPTELGVALNDAFITALPDQHAGHGVVMPDGKRTFEYVLEMPAGNTTPFRHVTLDWNPSGHEPEGIYDLPHLDVHFYLIDNEARLAINPMLPDFAEKGERLPSAEFMPTGYVNPGLPPVPLMGLHLADPTSPEFNGSAFTSTFLYGSWDGRLIFMEPMVTAAMLQQKQDVTMPIAMAERYEIPGDYPAAYRIRWDEATLEHRVALTNFQRR